MSGRLNEKRRLAVGGGRAADRRGSRLEIQLTLDTFDTRVDPLCCGRIESNRFKRLCYRCPHAERKDGELLCSLSDLPVRSWDKYALRGWKNVRKAILERDASRCALCGGSTALHIHHIDQDKTNDDPGNLLTLCGICHARVHTVLQNTEESGKGLDALRSVHPPQGSPEESEPN
ncbi:MAG: HNH endonuclease signature motif containing protein [Methanomicrobiales archaeon]|nr:HNH endonuclease signature motif containing protein [Methanomicrobiales archaeon]MDI6875245.1 HNH endonuclease signature motif containing protein [Methanomicrobiales archaeon]